MANLKDIAKSKGIEIKDRPTSFAPPAQKQEQPTFQKRRAWITESEEATKEVNKAEEIQINDTLTNREPLEKHNEIIIKPLENNNVTIRKSLGNDTLTNSKSSRKPLDKALDNNNAINRKPLDIDQLVGKEKVLVSFIVSLCKKRASLETDSVSSNELKSVLDLDNNGLANLIFRVKDKKYINIIEHKLGRVSWRKFSIPQDLYQNFLSKGLENHHETIRKPLDNHYETNSNPSRKPLDKSLENHSSSMYVGTNNTIHTGTENKTSETPNEWADLYEIDFSILTPWKINSSVIEQIKKNNWQITRYQLEEFIERFFIYFTESEYQERSKEIRSHYSFFLSSLKMISSGQPDSICDVKTKAEQAQELAIKNRMLKLEKEKRDRDMLNEKAENLREGEFEKWYAPLSENERTALVPPAPAAPYGSPRYRSMASSYFSENIWPRIKNELVFGHTN